MRVSLRGLCAPALAKSIHSSGVAGAAHTGEPATNAGKTNTAMNRHRRLHAGRGGVCAFVTVSICTL